MGKHAGPAEEDLPRSDMDSMTPQEKADTFDELYESNQGHTSSGLIEQWNESVKRRDAST